MMEIPPLAQLRILPVQGYVHGVYLPLGVIMSVLSVMILTQGRWIRPLSQFTF
jgi:hypothetical protein